ncbi:MAG: ACT domain-containing protein [Candidatus Aureabacteria bacterium]|nr:ACT domain-containing protein [Candidatus Auribacterota bacterium]
MKLKQLSIFIENRSGRLAEIAKLLYEQNINIRALSLADTADFGILRLIVNDIAKAHDILKEANFTVNETEVLAVEVPDKPGGLNGILGILSEENINLEYMYAFVEKSFDKAILVLRFENIEKAIEALKKHDINILSGEQVYNL